MFRAERILDGPGSEASQGDVGVLRVHMRLSTIVSWISTHTGFHFPPPTLVVVGALMLKQKRWIVQ
jgi:hypothetical protein